MRRYETNLLGQEEESALEKLAKESAGMGPGAATEEPIKSDSTKVENIGAFFTGLSDEGQEWWDRISGKPITQAAPTGGGATGGFTLDPQTFIVPALIIGGVLLLTRVMK